MIEAQGLTMHYGNFRAVEDCSFSVRQGEIVGLVGPNGAGKTTIMKILATQMQPTGGSAKVNGHDVMKEPIKAKQHLGFLPEQPPLYEDMEVREYLGFVGSSRGLKKERLRERLKWVAENCSLEPVWCKPISELSKGYKQRVGLAQALIHDPPVLILDEPTSGLDPLQIMEIRSLVKTLSKEKAILFSSHILQEISAITDRAVVISEGAIRADGSLEELAMKVKPDRKVFVRFSEADHVSEQELKNVLGLQEVSQGSKPSSFEITTSEPEKCLKSLANYAKDKHLTIIELFEEKPDLEEIFSALIHDSFRMKS